MDINEFIVITKALSDPQRVRAVLALQDDELCVCQIIELLKLAPSTISKHMSILKQAGIVESRKEGKWVYYSLVDENKKTEVMNFIHLTVNSLNNDLIIDEDKSHLQKIKKMDLTTLCKL